MGRFIKSTYLNKKETSNKKEKVVMVVKEEDGTKKHMEIVDPMMHYYVTKDEHWLPPNIVVGSMAKEKVRTVHCKHKDVIKSIVREAGNAQDKSEYDRILSSGNYEEFRKLKDFHLMNNVHGSDINIEDYNINEYIKQNLDSKVGIDICLFDIEVDGSQTVGPEPGMAEINIITVVDWSKRKCLTFALKYDTDNYNEVMTDKTKLMEDLNNIYNNKDSEIGEDLGLEFEIYELDTEMEIIKSFLYYINEISKPDICTAWNLDFDFATIFERIKVNGEDPADYFCSKDLQDKKAYYRLDKNATDAANRSSTFETNSYTNWIDQLALYANVNKPNGVMESVKLNDVGEKETGIKKDVYEGSISDLHFRDYYTFILYNIKDTVLTALIEKNTNMFDLLFSIVDMTRTRPSKALKKTICLRNRSSVFFENQGYVLSNNHSKILSDPNADKIRGGFVANMTLIERMGDILVKGRDIRSNRLFSNVCDFDLSSLYPSIIRGFNITPEGHIGKIQIQDKSTMTVPKYEEDKLNYDFNTEFISKFNSQDSVAFAQEFHGLPPLNIAAKKVSDKIKSKGA
ncbi:DNA polymerase exonuclease domain protein [Staphylococcus phage Machias]|nr:DNA polymerase exonuclease domain protein [Staphylococcus phage Machias]